MKVAIVCGNPKSEMLAPFNDKEWEIWVLGNRANRYLDKRVSRIFEIHDNIDVPNPDNKYCKWLAKLDIPLVVSEKFPIKGKHIIVFPYDKVLAWGDWITLMSSPAYMMAVAILEGAKEIAIYGVDLATDDFEYFHQRPCMQSWIRHAEILGIKVHIPKESALYNMNGFMEGRDWNAKEKKGLFIEAEFRKMAQISVDRTNQLMNEKHDIDLKIAAYDGGRQVYEQLAKTARAVEAKMEFTSLSDTLTTK